jgi:Kdo2-lipid IVA lauroyltransferase/acyltransferase
MRESLEFAFAWILVKLLGAMPRRWARALGSLIGSLAFALLGRLRRVGLTNLELAFPEKSATDREQILRLL